MRLASGLLCCNGNLLARGDGFSCRGFDFAPSRSRANACFLGSGHRLVFDGDRFEALLGDAKRHRPTVVIASPDRQRASCWDLLQQASADELVDDLSGGIALNVRRQFDSAIIALRSRGQNDQLLRIGESCHRDPPLRWRGLFCRHHHNPTLAMQPAGQDPGRAPRARNGHSTALFGYECQSFLDNLIAGLGEIGAWNDPRCVPALARDLPRVRPWLRIFN
jgi:hypothetical protein